MMREIETCGRHVYLTSNMNFLKIQDSNVFHAFTSSIDIHLIPMTMAI